MALNDQFVDDAESRASPKGCSSRDLPDNHTKINQAFNHQGARVAGKFAMHDMGKQPAKVASVTSTVH